ncbi:MAG: 2OG-Fe(II) oxygenase [Microscillaceae bacterium]|jgi:Rps23 Pro-64 3,4-dihydroxylase Tpa1-like proline 4-hydroxylase|nr:2OG-Fe(II) oxygenase [Microscillaceae bacterium]
MKILNPKYTEKSTIAQLKQDFQTAFPYKHLVMEDFLTLDFANTVHDNFPSIEKLNKHYNGLNERKSEGSNFSDFHPALSELRQLIMSKEFANWMAEVTGITEIFVTDDKLGTGLHQGSNGSFLDIHIDFNIHAEKNVHRRLNMLIYMNKDWQPEYGGDLEMWDAKMTKCEKKVAPMFNRAVVFETNEISYHGYSKISVPEGVTRKSFYSYFYTALREDASKYHDTVFRPKPEDSVSKKIGTNLKESIKNFTKAQLKKIGINI